MTVNSHISFFVGLMLSVLLSADSSKAQDLNSYRFEEVAELQNKEERPVLVYLTAEWCRYCKRMDHTVLQKKSIVGTLNSEYYFVEFDVEQQTPVTIGGRTYRFKPTGKDTGMHELAELIGTIDGSLNTPALVLMNSDFEILYRYGGYMDEEQFSALLNLAMHSF